MSVQTSPLVTVQPARWVRGQLRCPGDKSISHRYAILAAIADGTSWINGYAPGNDCAATLDCLKTLGVTVKRHNIELNGNHKVNSLDVVEIVGCGLRGLKRSNVILDAHNSGTTLRLLTGVLAAHSFATTLTGDSSLQRRPMKRLIDPLEQMGARVSLINNKLPLTIMGTDLRGIDYVPLVPSAQVKTAILLAGLQARGSTIVSESIPTRDHTERALSAFGIIIERNDKGVLIRGGQRLHATSQRVPGDFSSAAFWTVAAAALPGSDIELVDVGLNPTRIALLDVLRRVGARIDISIDHETAGEPTGRLRIRHHQICPINITAAEVPAIIDELPALAALATHGGDIRVTGAEELRTKESDRISMLVSGLRNLGADASELSDGFHVRGATRPVGGVADAAGDHRLAMTFAIVALGASNPCVIKGADSVAVSYPNFFETLETLCENT